MVINFSYSMAYLRSNIYPKNKKRYNESTLAYESLNNNLKQIYNEFDQINKWLQNVKEINIKAKQPNKSPMNTHNKTKNKKKYKKRNGKNKGKSKKIQKNKNEEDNLEIEDNNVDDPIVLQFKNDINEKVIFANTITKIKPSISENWIKTISSC